jgi:glycosyltransferase involved in cell wall biosynthesis
MLVSVIIPCYNVEQYIAECIESVLNQSYKQLEIICIDNNSTDQTWSKLSQLKVAFPQIIIDRENKQGAPAARNKGLTLATGDWIQFLDADDLLLTNKIEHQINLVRTSKHTNLAFVAGVSTHLDMSGRQTHQTVIESNHLLAPFINQCGNTCANLWKRTDLIDVGMWDEKLKSSQETDLMMRLILNGKKYIADNNSLTVVRERSSGQISQRNPAEKWQQYIDIRLHYIKQLKDQFPHQYFDLSGKMFDFVMVSIINLSAYDKEKAISYYQHQVKSQWRSANSYGFSKLKLLLIKIFGIKILFR